MQIDNEFQNKAKKKLSSLLGIDKFEIKGPSGEEYYYLLHDNLKYFIHEDSLQVFGNGVEIREEIQDYKNDNDLIDYFVSKVEKLNK